MMFYVHRTVLGDPLRCPMRILEVKFFFLMLGGVWLT